MSLLINASIDISSLTVYGTCLAKNLLRWTNAKTNSNRTTPYGTLFNPFSIETEIARLFHNKELTYFVDENGRFHDQCRTWIDFDSANSLVHYNHIFDEQAKQYLLSASAIVISYGAIESWSNIYMPKNIYNKIPVPIDDVDRDIWLAHLPDAREIVEAIENTIILIRINLNNSIPIIFSVCPVKIKFTLSEFSKEYVNHITKNLLRNSIKEVVSEQYNCFYFPSYELFCDMNKMGKAVQLDGRHLLPDTLNEIYNHFLIYTPHADNHIFEKEFWIPYYNEMGNITGKIYTGNRVELY